MPWNISSVSFTESLNVDSRCVRGIWTNFCLGCSRLILLCEMRWTKACNSDFGIQGPIRVPSDGYNLICRQINRISQEGFYTPLPSNYPCNKYYYLSKWSPPLYTCIYQAEVYPPIVFQQELNLFNL